MREEWVTDTGDVLESEPEWLFYTAYESMTDWNRLAEYDAGERGLVGLGDIKKLLIKRGHNGATIYITLFAIILIGSLMSAVKP